MSRLRVQADRGRDAGKEHMLRRIVRQHRDGLALQVLDAADASAPNSSKQPTCTPASMEIVHPIERQRQRRREVHADIGRPPPSTWAPGSPRYRPDHRQVLDIGEAFGAQQNPRPRTPARCRCCEPWEADSRRLGRRLGTGRLGAMPAIPARRPPPSRRRNSRRLSCMLYPFAAAPLSSPLPRDPGEQVGATSGPLDRRCFF